MVPHYVEGFSCELIEHTDRLIQCVVVPLLMSPSTVEVSLSDVYDVPEVYRERDFAVVPSKCCSLKDLKCPLVVPAMIHLNLDTLYFRIIRYTVPKVLDRLIHKTELCAPRCPLVHVQVRNLRPLDVGTYPKEEMAFAYTVFLQCFAARRCGLSANVLQILNGCFSCCSFF